MSRSLMASRRFAPLFWCQFFSAFNDNFLKNALVFLILFGVHGAGGGAEGGAGALVTLAGAAFIAPFFLLSGLGGELADRYDKALVARRLKAAEIAAAGVAVLGFFLASVPVLFVALVMFGSIAALFGPIKYGILPDHLAKAELPAGNALVEAATFLAILTGTIAGGLAVTHGGAPIFGALVMGFAVLCWAASLMIPPTGEAAPTLAVDRNVLRSTASLVRDLYADTRLWRTGLITCWFWLVGAVVLALLPVVAKATFGGDETVVTAMLALFSIGVALGSGLASWLSAGRIVLLPTPLAAFAMAAFSLDIAVLAWSAPPLPAVPVGALDFFASWRGVRLGLDFVGLAAAAGLFIVPSFAALQAWTPKERRARVIAASNVLSAALIVLGAAGIAALQGAGFSGGALFLIVALANLAAGIAVLAVLPTSPFRDFLSILFRAFYRMEVRGLENLEKAGPGAIVALNHVSFLDGGLALSLMEEEPVFAIDHGIAKRWWVRPFVWLTKALPLDPTKPLATRRLINAVKAGETLIIFPEGRLTVTGSLMKVYDGAGLIADKSGAVVVPVKIEGPERTLFSRLSRAQVRRRWWPKITVTVLEPVRLAVDPALKGKQRRQAAGAALYGVMSDLIFRTAPTDRTVFEAVVQAAEREGAGRIAVEDPVAGRLSYRKLLLGTRVLAGKLAPLAPAGGAVGVMLPNANGAAVAVLALMSAGRVPAMINFTAGATTILSACTAAEVETLVTSRAFVEKGRLDALVAALGERLRIVYLEDVRATVGLADKLGGLMNWRHALHPRRPDDPAAILFTSGSEGTPKGVVLSHRNMLANAAQAQARIDFGRTDKVFNVLPVFHSFGLTVGLVLPLVSGVPVYLYPSPLHYRVVPELVYGSNATILFGTDTFLAGYARAAHPYDFRSLRYILAGAEPVKAQTRKVYAEKFGLRILEGYGVTETAPVLALNTPMFNRFGTVGRIMPGMEARLEPVPGVEEGGRLFVRGPNVMLGYLRAEKPGVLEPPPGGWHDTGDIVTLDETGFVTIRGRAKRFAKVGGEMISLAAVEAMAADLWPDAASAVATRPDPRKGERLILVTERRDATRAAFQAHARAAGASELAVPAEILVVDRLPQLGSGKTDFSAVTALVRERAPAEAAE